MITTLMERVQLTPLRAAAASAASAGSASAGARAASPQDLADQVRQNE